MCADKLPVVDTQQTMFSAHPQSEVPGGPHKLKKIRLERRSFSDATSAMMKAIRKVPVQRLPEFFEQTCDRLPFEIAVICGEAQLTYQELELRANQLAHFLVARGVGRGSALGILLEPSLEACVALLGVLKTGAAFVPLDPAFPSDVLAFIAEDARLGGLITTSVLRRKMRVLSCPVLELDRAHVALSAQPDTRPQISADPASLCSIMYTFDATSQPKGVAISHANIVTALREAIPIYRIRRRDRVYQGMSIASDLSLQEIWPAWGVGATLVIAPADCRSSGHRLTEFLCEQKMSVLYCTPRMLATIERDVPSLRSIVIGGEVCPAYLVSRWARPGRRMLSTYSAAEIPVMATWGELFPGRPATFGAPLPTYQVYLLDDHLAPVAQGRSGEIYIGGPGVAMGYFNRPDITKDRFLPNPVWRDREIVPCVYRTGEKGRMTAAGEIEYLGHNDGLAQERPWRNNGKESAALLSSANAAFFKEEAGVSETATVILPALKRGRWNTMYQQVMTDPLYRNALFNMAGTFILGGLGFVFWIIVARLYTAEQVGIATTLISVMALLSSVTELGIGSNLMRHLPTSAHKNELINSLFGLVMLVTLVASALFLLGLPIFSPQLLFLRSKIFYTLSFTIFVIFGAWNGPVECTFMAFRSADSILKKNTIISVIKIILPVILMMFGAYGIFASASSALAVGMLVSFVLLLSKFNIRPSLKIDLSLIKETFGYSFTNYIVNFSLSVPSFILPVLILNTLSAKYAAYYYVASTIQTNLQVIPSATTQALLTEGAYNETELKKHLKKAMVTTFVVLIPATGAVVLGGGVVLQFFGKDYAVEALQFLRLYSISTLFTAFIFIYNAVMNVKRHIKSLVIWNVAASALTLGLSWAFISYGLSGVGWGWIVGQALAGLVALCFILKVFFTTSS